MSLRPNKCRGSHCCGRASDTTAIMFLYGLVWCGMTWYGMTLYGIATYKPATQFEDVAVSWVLLKWVNRQKLWLHLSQICVAFHQWEAPVFLDYLYQKAEILFPRNDKSDFTAVNHFDDVQLRSIKIIYCLYLSLFTNKAVLYFFDKLSRMALSWINQTLVLETKKPRSQPKQARLLKPKQQICCWRCRHGYHGGQRSRQKLGLHLSQGEVLPFLTSRVNAFYTEACLYALQPVFLHISWGHLLCGKRLVFVEHSLCIHHIA